jgi:HAD superfamily hydrolase (TIGR01493 family)
MSRERWATFDCYGTLIDWNGGIRGELARVFGEERADAELARYHELEPTLQAGGGRSYREVMTVAMAALGAPSGEEGGLAAALPDWGPFPEVRASLEEARSRGWKLALLSNTDRDLIEASIARIGVPFELAIVASEIDSYKPRHYHDIVPANELGLQSIWINRYAEHHEPPATRELADLSALSVTLDELVAP